MSYLKSLDREANGERSSKAVNIDISNDPTVVQDQCNMMEIFFDQVRQSTHENIDGSFESDSFLPLFTLPTCYNMPKIMEAAPGPQGQPGELISKEKCKIFPDKVLFYIFYS